MSKRFTDEYKRSYRYLANKLLKRVLDKDFRGKPFTIYMVQNWIYSKSPNEILEKEFEALMQEEAPESLEGAFVEGELSDVV